MVSEISFAMEVMRKWPAYKKYVEATGVNLTNLSSLSDLPLVDKQFLSTAITSIPLFNVKSIIPSSGTASDTYSFGLFDDTEIQNTATEIDSFLNDRFNVQTHKTLLLNLLPGSISIPSSVVSVASIGVRLDTAINAINSFGSSFDQIILVGEPLFMKCLLEAGIENSINWMHMPLCIILGGEWISESYRTYLESIVGFNKVYSSMGTAELGLNYFVETEETVLLRRLLYENRDLLEHLIGHIDYVPMLFGFNKDRLLMESVKKHDDIFESIILTALDPHRSLPLIRYEIGDKGVLLTRRKIKAALKTIGYEDLADAMDSVILAHFGRGKNMRGIYPEAIKEHLFKVNEIASYVTGQFMLSEHDNAIKLLVQLKEHVKTKRSLVNSIKAVFAHLPIIVEVRPFGKYPYGLDFERKVKYFNENKACAI